MAQRLQEIMTPDPVTVSRSSGLVEAARRMREADVGDVIVVDGDRPIGIATDRDLVVRGVAAEAGLADLTIEDVCTTGLVSAGPDDSVDDAAALMRQHAVRRLVVMDGDRLVGVVSIGDLAIEEDEDSVLAEISSAAGEGGR